MVWLTDVLGALHAGDPLQPVTVVAPSPYLLAVVREDLREERIITVERIAGLVRTVSLHVPGTNTYAADGVWAHNDAHSHGSGSSSSGSGGRKSGGSSFGSSSGSDSASAITIEF